MTLRCPYCSKSVPNKRHQALCPKRPGRPLGAARKGSARKAPRKPHPEPVGLVEAAENDAAERQDGGFIEAAADPVPDDALPDFSAPDPGLDGPQAAPSAAPQATPAAAPPIQDSVLWESVVSFICDGVDAAVKGTIGDKPATPQPPASIPPEKRKQLAEAIGAAVAAYGGGAAQLLGKWGPAINLAFVAGSIFLPTIMQARAYIAWKQGEERKAKDEAKRVRELAAGPLAAAARPPAPEESEYDAIARKQAERQAAIERDGQLARRMT